MIKEIVDFSRQLETSGIYERISASLKRIDRPIMVIPVRDDLTDILADEIYFVFKRIEGEHCFLEDDKPIKIDDRDTSSLRLKGIDTEDEQWQEILRSVRLYTEKLKSDKMGNKSIGGNKGTNSYHLLIFEGKIEDGIFDVDKSIFENKMSRAYEKETIEKGMPDDLEKNGNERFTELLEKVKEHANLDRIWNEIEKLKKDFEVFNKKTESLELPFKSIFIVFKLPRRFYEENNIYREWYDKYLQKKIFKVDKPGVYYKANCGICGSKDVDTYLPDCFNNLNDKKPFLRHIHRPHFLNIMICSDCALKIYKFQSKFLDYMRMSIFPLFIDENFRQKEIRLFKDDSEGIKKLGFKEIVENISLEVDKYTLDYYLIIYKKDVLFLDYVSGFRSKINGRSIFEIEDILNKSFFESSLKSNYFGEVDTKRKNLDLLIYKYRTLIFDFLYRAKYRNFNRSIIEDIFMDSLGFKFRALISDKKLYFKLRDMKNEFFKLDNLIGGERMKKIEEIKKSIEVTDAENFSYYAGQVVYFLLSKSKAGKQTHSLVEPFINVGSTGILVDRILEMFNKYKHEIWLSSSTFNKTLSGILAFYNDNKEMKFDKDFRILFFAGYLDDNIFFKSQQKKGGINNDVQ